MRAAVVHWVDVSALEKASIDSEVIQLTCTEIK